MNALREFLSLVCACGDKKRNGRSFCMKCYRKLPPNMQGDLYKRFGAGYEEAYARAKKYLFGTEVA